MAKYVKHEKVLNIISRQRNTNKITMSYNHSPTKVAKTGQETRSADKDMEQGDLLTPASGSINCTTTLETVWQISLKLSL